MIDEALDALSERIRALGDQPVAEHADVLEEVHEALVNELEGLGTTHSPQAG